MDLLTLVFISVKLLEVIISIIMSGPTIPPFTNSGTNAFICSISFNISEDVIICISKSVTVKCSGRAVNIFYNLCPRINVPVSPSFQTTLAQFKESNSISLVTKSIWKCHCLVTINELLIPVCTFVTASLYCIPFNLSLKTPVIDDVVYSIESIAS